MENKRLILASASPRRRDILESAGYRFEIITADCDEALWNNSCTALAIGNAKLKAMAVQSDNGDAVIIGADTVVCVNGDILGKPKDPEDAKRMLSLLSENEHSVITGFAICSSEKTVLGHCETTVKMRKIHTDEMDAYIATGSPLDKAGAYGIQDAAGMFVSEIKGDYYNVVGLPLSKISEFLRTEFNISAFMK